MLFKLAEVKAESKTIEAPEINPVLQLAGPSARSPVTAPKTINHASSTFVLN